MAINPELYINRELSWLAFDARVLNEAFDSRNPLLERRQFLAGVTAATGPDGIVPAELVSAIRARILELVGMQQHCLHDILLPALETHGVRLVTMSELSAG